MTKLIAGMTMSLDGFIADANGSAGALYADFEELLQSPAMKHAFETTGAVIMGRRIFDTPNDPDSYAADYEFRTPLIIVTSKAPAKHPKEGNGVTITFATNGIHDAVRLAKEAAKGRDVQCVGGAMLIQSLLRERLIDELHMDISPILLGEGRRLFDDAGQHTLKLVSASNLAGGRTSLIYTFA